MSRSRQDLEEVEVAVEAAARRISDDEIFVAELAQVSATKEVGGASRFKRGDTQREIYLALSRTARPTSRLYGAELQQQCNGVVSSSFFLRYLHSV